MKICRHLLSILQTLKTLPATTPLPVSHQVPEWTQRQGHSHFGAMVVSMPQNKAAKLHSSPDVTASP